MIRLSARTTLTGAGVAALCLYVASAGAVAPSGAAGASPADPLLRSFRDPPMSARPRTWWHWLNGNITVAGLDADLGWMKRAGLGGVQAFDASLGTPQLVAHRLAYMTPEWKAAFDHAAATADRLGLELAISSSPGWSETGGPWVPPADGMKKLVWSEVDVTGGRPVTRPLALPPTTTGPYGTVPYHDALGPPGMATPALGTASGAVAVFAYPFAAAPATDDAIVTVDGRRIDAAALGDGREDTSVDVPRQPGAVAAITLAWSRPRTVRSATILVPDAVVPFGGATLAPVLEAEVDGGWRKVADLPLANIPTTVSFAAVTATSFRVSFPDAPKSGAALAAPAPGAQVIDIFARPGGDHAIAVATLVLSDAARVDRFEAKAGFAAVPDYYALSAGVADMPGTDPATVVDLSDRMRADGTLDWTPPAGRWRIVRMGWSLIGTTNHPAAPDSTGLEVDKYDAAAVGRYMDHYIGTYRGAIDAGHVKALVTDSIEAGDANWTPGLLDTFRRLRGYDARPWLPTLTGAVIGSRTRSDAFLYDWRRTLADLLASAHYGTIADTAHRAGLKVYGEALEDGRPQLGDDLAMRAHADVPMAAMWAFGRDEAPRTTLIGDVYGAASVAHVTGRNLVAAESFTAAFSPWAFAPADLKHVADFEFALGVNRPVIHTSPSSPMDDKLPGLSLAIFGQYFNRHETWAEMARPWVDYLARASLLLQQGRHVADIAYFIGEEAPLTALYMKAPPADVPVGRGFDFVDAGLLADQLSVADGDIVSKGGARYRALYLGGTSARMTLPTLRRIAALVDAGATVVGDAPSGSPSLRDDPTAYAALVRHLWGAPGETRAGRGRVVAGHDLDRALARAGVARDFAYPGQDDAILFQHRAMPGADVYFLANRGHDARRITARFRVAGRTPELWHADTGTTEPLSFDTAGGTTSVPIDLPAQESAFVVFRSGRGGHRAVVPAVVRPVATIAGGWQVAFQTGRGAPATIAMPRLMPLDEAVSAGVRYFSGVATYTTRFDLAPADAAGGRLLLDLGRIGDVAEVRVNGVPVGTTWHAPYRLDLGRAAHAGTNTLEVRVANLWVNRLIGDVQPGAAKISFTVAPTYRPDAPLRPSGLIGPVTILSQTGAR